MGFGMTALEPMQQRSIAWTKADKGRLITNERGLLKQRWLVNGIKPPSRLRKKIADMRGRKGAEMPRVLNIALGVSSDGVIDQRREVEPPRARPQHRENQFSLARFLMRDDREHASGVEVAQAHDA
jgi:hypothetical protein